MQMRMNVARTLLVPAILLGLAVGLPSADARGLHGGSDGHHHAMGGSGDGSGTHSRTFAGDQRHSDDEYVKAAAQEEDKLLDSKIKSICRGC